MKNKLTVLGLVAATAFIFTSCTKDSDVTPGNNAPQSPILEEPSINDEATGKFFNEYAEADNGLSIPSIETAPVIEPVPTPPTVNSTTKVGYYKGIKGLTAPSPVPPVGDQGYASKTGELYLGVKPGAITPASEDAFRKGGFKNQYPISAVPSEPHVVPNPALAPVQSSPNAGRVSGNGLPDCTFPVVQTKNDNM